MYWKTYYNGFNRYIVYHHSNMIWFRLITNNPSMKKKQVILCLLVIRTSLTSRTLVVWKFTGPFPTLCISLLLYVKNLRTTHKQNCSMADCGRPTILQDPEKILRRSWTCKTWLIIKAPTSKVWDIIWYYEMLSTQGTSGHLSFKQGSWV
jgi:hypothetical protein